MNYDGSRIKIKGNTFPNRYMAKGSWRVLKTKRIANSWIDANGVLHENYFYRPKIEIAFDIKEHNLAEHENLSAFFLDKTNVTVKYFDDELCDYVTINAKIDDVQWEHIFADETNIQYAQTSIVITEY